jgi:hypothetical protein
MNDTGRPPRGGSANMLPKIARRAIRSLRVAGLSRCLPSDWFVLPGLLIVGAQRAGTTSLHRYLVHHPWLRAGQRKEVHFFDRRYHKGARWYRAHFHSRLTSTRRRRANGHEPIAFEASPYYLFHPLVPARVHALLPEVKLIALLRDPTTRTYSHYHHARRRGNESLDLDEAIRREAERLSGEVERMRDDPRYRSHSHEHQSYLARGRYVEQLIEWHQYFPRDRTLIIKSEELYSTPASVLDGVCEFMSIPAIDWTRLADRLGAYNKGSYPPMPRTVRAELKEYFRPFNQRLYDYLGRDFGWDV